MEQTKPEDIYTVAGIVAAVAIGYLISWNIGIVIALIVFYARGRIKRVSISTRATAIIPDDIFHWKPTDYYDFEVVGESNYQSALEYLAGNHGRESADVECTAMLIPENNNRYDDKAIRVDIDDMTVGYLSREDARSFRRRLGAKKLTNQVTTCDAIIHGGFIRKNGERAFYGVSLAIKTFDE